MNIAARNVTKRYGGFTALDRITLDVRSGELLALLGPSGSGKTTLLRIIAGLDWPDEGEVQFDGENALARSVGERSVGFVFQHYALFRHMTVFENIAFGLRARRRRDRLSEAEIRARVEKLLDLIQLGWLVKRYPGQLSGGQRQRVALARALAIEPRVLLLDEPFGSLDAKVRKELRHWLRNLHSEIHVTSIFVTHDQEEALEVADRVVVMDRGRIEQAGTPEEVYERPATAFVNEFLGDAIVIPVQIEGGAIRYQPGAAALDAGGIARGPGRLFVRPHEMAVVPIHQAAFRGIVRRTHGLGRSRRVEIALGPADGGPVIEIDAVQGEPLADGDCVGLQPRRYRVFADPQGDGK
jgi:sulfate/thiosulfate transport system ATP-binding protein